MTKWKPIPGFNGWYDVSDDGAVRSWRRGRWPGRKDVPKPMFIYPDHRGYLIVQLTRDGNQHPYAVHRLLALAFFGPRPPGLEVRHLDGVKEHTTVSNLAYGTPAENQRDIVEHGRNVNASKTHCPQGHAYDERNTRFNPNGSRECRACCARRQRARRAKVRA